MAEKFTVGDAFELDSRNRSVDATHLQEGAFPAEWFEHEGADDSAPRLILKNPYRFLAEATNYIEVTVNEAVSAGDPVGFVGGIYKKCDYNLLVDLTWNDSDTVTTVDVCWLQNDSDGKVLFVVCGGGITNAIEVRVGIYNPATETLTWGTAATISATVTSPCICRLDDTHFVIANEDSDGHSNARVGTVTPATGAISFSSMLEITTAAYSLQDLCLGEEGDWALWTGVNGSDSDIYIARLQYTEATDTLALKSGDPMKVHTGTIDTNPLGTCRLGNTKFLITYEAGGVPYARAYHIEGDGGSRELGDNSYETIAAQAAWLEPLSAAYLHHGTNAAEPLAYLIGEHTTDLLVVETLKVNLGNDANTNSDDDIQLLDYTTFGDTDYGIGSLGAAMTQDRIWAAFYTDNSHMPSQVTFHCGRIVDKVHPVGWFYGDITTGGSSNTNARADGFRYGGFVCVDEDQSGDNYLRTKIVEMPAFLGLALEDAASGETCRVAVRGVVEDLSGLTAGTDCFLDYSDGSLKSGFSDGLGLRIGKCLSSTKILLDDRTGG